MSETKSPYYGQRKCFQFSSSYLDFLGGEEDVLDVGPEDVDGILLKDVGSHLVLL